jgi:hypothetical protein
MELPAMANITENASVAPLEMSGKLWRVRVIQEGQGSSAYYDGDILEANAHMFTEGRKIYMNHPGEDEKLNRPVRDARDIIGVMKTNGQYDKTDRAVYQEAKIYPEWQDWVKNRAEDGVIGLSVRAEGDIEESSGHLKSITKVHSVDLVTEPGAGGGFHTLLESANGTAPNGAPREEEEMEFPKELAEALDANTKDVKTLLEAIAPLVAALQESKSAADKAKADAEKAAKPTYLDIDKALTEAKLPAASRASVIALVESGAELKATVDAEAAKVKAILESAEGNGNFGNVKDEVKDKTTLAESVDAAVANIWG